MLSSFPALIVSVLISVGSPPFLGSNRAKPARTIILRHDVEHDRSAEEATEYSGLAHLNFITRRGFKEGEATLIAPRWLLTAAHVTRRLNPGQVISVGGEHVEVAAVIRHPDWSPGPGGRPDLALVRLAAAIEQTRPVPIYRGNDEVGRDIVLLGLGDYGDGVSGPVDNDGRVRLATNRVDRAIDGKILFDFDSPESGEATRFEGVSGPGDSGGPALMTVGGVTYLVGVSSGQERRDAAGPGRYGVVEHYTRVSEFAEWIDDTIDRP